MLWEQDRQKKIQREEQDRAHRNQMNQEMILMLGQQVEAMKKHAQEEALLKFQEAKLMVY
jgi:hypothetical protein